MSGDDEDPTMQSMRSVWLSMRDEEPSTSGLDALLAAARSKAVEMQPKPSWWQTVLATLRRPPVLAFATVVILVSGAFLVRNRDATPVVDSRPVATEPPLTHPPSPPPPTELVAKPPEEKLAETTKKDPQPETSKGKIVDWTQAERPAIVVQTQPRIPPVANGQGSAAPPLPPPVVHQEAPPPDTQKEDRLRETEEAQTIPGGIVSETATVKTAIDKKKQAADEIRPGRLEIADDDAARPTKPSSGSFGLDSTSAGKTVVKSTSKPPPQRGPSSDQLIQQAETAANRGDCTAAKVTAERIKKIDADAYRDRVAKNTAIARCLTK